MNNISKTKWIYIVFLFILFFYISTNVYEKFEWYENSIENLNDKIHNLNDKVNNLEDEIILYNDEVNSYEKKLESLNDFQNSYRIKSETPYEFIKNTKFSNNIVDFRRIDLGNGKIITKAKVEIQGVNNVIDFLSHINRKYEWYYAANEINR